MSIDEAREFFDERVKDIQIHADVDRGVMMSINAQLDELYNDISSDYAFWKGRLEVIESKINQVEKGEATVGPNEEKRKARAIKIAQHYPIANFADSSGLPTDYDYESYDGEVINLYQIREECLTWFNLFQHILNSIDFKSRRLIITAAALKVDGIINSRY